MTTAPEPLDAHARQLHASALAHTSAATLARLRDARRAANAAPATRTWRASWLAGGAVAAALALAVVLRPEASLPPVGGTDTTVADAAEPAGPLQEDPVFYLWLASADAPALALE